MFCQNCGTKNDDSNVTCTNCGAALRIPQPQQTVQPQPQQYAPQPQPQYAPQPQQSPSGPVRQPKPPRMSYPPQGQPSPVPNGSYAIAPPQRSFDFYPFWYKFMLYAGFFISSLAFFFIGLGQLIGWQYGASDAYAYVKIVKNSVGGLRAADIISGILFLILSIASIYVWYQFRYLRYNAPLFTLILYGGAAGLYVLYFMITIIVLATTSKTKLLGLTATEVFPIVFPILLMLILGTVLAAQIIYFKSEKRLFVYYPQPKPAATYPQNGQYSYPQENQNIDYSQNNQNIDYSQNNQNGGY